MNTVTVTGIEYVADECVVADLTVVDNHNLFVSENKDETYVLAHNCLDENLKPLAKTGVKPYSLGAVFCRYGNDFYLEAEFSKGERHTISHRKLDRKVYNYAGMDTQSIMGIQREQVNRAKLMTIGDKSYEKPYIRLVTNQMSAIIHTMSTMEQRGIKIDLVRLFELRQNDSELNSLIKTLHEEMYALDTVKEANRILLKRNKVPARGLLGKKKTVMIFDIGKPEHRAVLFFKVLGLKPLSFGTDGTPKADKFFQKHYAMVKEVELLTNINKAKSIKNSYINAFYKRLRRSDDGKKTGRIFPSYGYSMVVTGRANSFKPSLHQIPQHSSVAKFIKQVFVAPSGKCILKVDYSAHEVRGWGLISRDSVLGQAFQKAINIKNGFRRKPSQEQKARINTEADTHRINYEFFTGVPAKDVTAEQRQESKGITFGAIYGMAASTLAGNLKKSLKYVEGLLGRFFSKFSKASKWLKWTVTFAQKYLYTFSPLGRRRNLYGYLTGAKLILSAMNRRAQNSPIQGLGSDIGFLAARMISRELYKMFEELGYDMEIPVLPADINNMVHDSIELEVPWELLPIVTHIVEYCMTVGVRQICKEVFGFNFIVGLEVEFDFGYSGDKMRKWDFSYEDFSKEGDSDDSFWSLIGQALKDAKDRGAEDVAKLKDIKKAAKNPKYTKIMDRYPLDLEIR